MAPKRTISTKKPASPRRIVISEEEFSTGITNLDNIQAGVEEFQTHGFIILENAIANTIVDKLGNQMRADIATCLTFPDLVFNHGNERNNFSVTPPLSDGFIFEDIWANRHAAAIMQQIIGPRPLLCWASSNVAIQSISDARQAVHSDAYTDIPDFPFCVEMNIYLQDTTPENGSTEIWPGTHVFTEDDHLPHGRGFIKKKAFTDRARTSPPIQPTIPAGSILMRDLRLWHSGMPNTTPTPRIIIALLYFPQWFRPHMRLTLPASVRPKAEVWTHIDLLSNTDFVEGSVDHLHMRFPMNFTQDPTKAMVEYRRAMDRLQGREPGAIIPVTKDNYWTPSRYQTRAARKRKREVEEDDDGDKKRQKQEEMNSAAKSRSRIELEPIYEPETKHKMEAEQEPERPWLTHRPEIIQEQWKIQNEPKEDMNSVDELSDYKDSPGYPPEWMNKLQDDQAAEERKLSDVDYEHYEAPSGYDYGKFFPKHQPETQGHKSVVKHDTKLLEDLPDYEDTPVNNVFPHLRQNEEKYDAAGQAWVSAAQKATFKLDFVPYMGPGSGISPQFSPKSEPESLSKPNMTQEAGLDNQLHENVYKQHPASVAKPTQTPPPRPLTKAQATWERDPRPYKGSRPSTPKYQPLGSPFKSLPPVQHASPYCASRAIVPSSPLAHPPMQHSQQPSAEPDSAPEETAPREPNATDAYDAFIQAQLLEKQERELKRAELKRLRDEKRLEAEAAAQKQKMDREEEARREGDGEEWLSVEESRERECGW